MIFVDWYGKKTKPPAILAESDFTCLVLDEDGLWEFDSYCRAEQITEEFYAIGSGGKGCPRCDAPRCNGSGSRGDCQIS